MTRRQAYEAARLPATTYSEPERAESAYYRIETGPDGYRARVWLASRTDDTYAQPGPAYDGDRCTWCYLGYPHTPAAHEQKANFTDQLRAEGRARRTAK